MKTDVITISSTGNQMKEALAQAEKVAAYKELNSKNALHLRLLAEEMLAMMRSITGETDGLFWIDVKDNDYQLHLQTVTRMNSTKRSQLIAASTTGENESAKGFMGRLREMFDRSADQDVIAFSNPLLMSGALDSSSTPVLDWEWSMSRYEENLASMIDNNNDNARAAWDELEKSVVHSVADEVRVSIKGQQAEMIIYKKMS